MKWFVCLLFLSSCFNGNSSFDLPLLGESSNPRKQKQKIATLQKKLEVAEKERKKMDAEIEMLAKEIDQTRLSLIRRQVDRVENQLREPVKNARKLEEKATSLFLDEREDLYKMIQTGPSPSAFEAQVELDRILRMITELSDGFRR